MMVSYADRSPSTQALCYDAGCRDGPIPDFCQYPNMPILISADMPIPKPKHVLSNQQL